MEKATLRNVRELVEKRLEFKGSNLSGKQHGEWYLVLSYGWYILHATKDGKKWLTNSEKYSPSTSRQQNKSWPDNYDEMTDMTQEQLKTATKF